MERKKLSDIAWNVDEAAYRADPAYSYSTLSRFQREGFNGLPNLFTKIETPSLTFGSVVDTLVTGTKEEFDERFLVASFPDLQDNRIKAIKEVYSLSAGADWNSIPDSVFNTAIENVQFQMNWKPETRLRVIKECGKEYYDLLCISADKTIISNDLYLDAVACVDALRSSPATKEFFGYEDPFDTDTERFYQLKFKGSFDGIPLRCMADCILVNHKYKYVCPVDLKTSSHKEWDFGKSFIEYRYMIQAQLYWYLIRKAMDNDDYFKDFKLLNYRFIVVCNSSRIPLAWEFEDTQSIVDFKYGKNVIPHWTKIVKELDYYLKNSSIVPIGINTSSTNSLKSWINSQYGE
jgi:hypothetical protein